LGANSPGDTTPRDKRRPRRDLDLAGTRSGRLRDIDDAHDVLWPSELGDLEGAHMGSP
jgi:hypothetical protein